jgi:hypothetical protein
LPKNTKEKKHKREKNTMFELIDFLQFTLRELKLQNINIKEILFYLVTIILIVAKIKTI